MDVSVLSVFIHVLDYRKQALAKLLLFYLGVQLQNILNDILFVLFTLRDDSTRYNDDLTCAPMLK